MPSNSRSEDYDAKVRHLYAEGNSLISAIRNSSKPRIFIISGPSGVGKDAVIAKLRNTFGNAQYVVTATTRPMRDGEVDGQHYIFLTKEEFQGRIDRQDFIEHDTVYDNFYGVPRSPIVDGLSQGRDVIIKVDVKGAETLRGLIEQAISIFICPESMEVLHARLRDRKTEDREVLLKRFTTATAELQKVKDFDYVVFNEDDQLDSCVQEIINIVNVERNRVDQPDIVLP